MKNIFIKFKQVTVRILLTNWAIIAKSILDLIRIFTLQVHVRLYIFLQLAVSIRDVKWPLE